MTRESGGAFPTITDATQIRVQQTNLFTGTATDGQLYAVTGPYPVPQGKHWIVTNASVQAFNNGGGGIVFMAIVNSAAFGEMNGLILENFTEASLGQYLSQIGAVIVPAIVEAG
jgi:hypothetical protein